MHYHCEIHVPENVESVEGYVKTILHPHKEMYDEAEDETAGFWDWYQIGGRWTGVHVPDYDPAKDERNRETCGLCHGTGKRPDMVVANGCNKCTGTGVAEKWPTEWAKFEGDTLPIDDVSDDLECHTLIASGQVIHTEEWNGEDFIKTGFDGKVKAKLAALGISSGRLVTVDYHS